MHGVDDSWNLEKSNILRSMKKKYMRIPLVSNSWWQKNHWAKAFGREGRESKL